LDRVMQPYLRKYNYAERSEVPRMQWFGMRRSWPRLCSNTRESLNAERSEVPRTKWFGMCRSRTGLCSHTWESITMLNAVKSRECNDSGCVGVGQGYAAVLEKVR